MRAALHLTLTPIVFLFGAKMLLGGATVLLFDADTDTSATPAWLAALSVVVSIAALAGGVAYGWRNRRR